ARDAALKAAEAELVKEGLLTKNGEVSAEAKKLFGWEREIALPTAGIIVKGCLDECDTCEQHLEREIELDLQRKHLESGLVKRQVGALDKAQEARWCPEGDQDDGREPSSWAAAAAASARRWLCPATACRLAPLRHRLHGRVGVQRAPGGDPRPRRVPAA